MIDIIYNYGITFYDLTNQTMTHWTRTSYEKLFLLKQKLSLLTKKSFVTVSKVFPNVQIHNSPFLKF